MAWRAVAVPLLTNEGLKSKAEKQLALSGNPMTEQRSALSSAALSWVGLAWSAGSSGLAF